MNRRPNFFDVTFPGHSVGSNGTPGDCLDFLISGVSGRVVFTSCHCITHTTFFISSSLFVYSHSFPFFLYPSVSLHKYDAIFLFKKSFKFSVHIGAHSSSSGPYSWILTHGFRHCDPFLASLDNTGSDQQMGFRFCLVGEKKKTTGSRLFEGFSCNASLSNCREFLDKDGYTHTEPERKRRKRSKKKKREKEKDVPLAFLNTGATR